MKIFLDSADIDKIKKFVKYGFIDGITTNPSLLAPYKKDKLYKKLLSDICAVVSSPVSASVVSRDADGMLKEAAEFLQISRHIIIKLPATPEGFLAANKLNKDGHKTNITLCFNIHQALLAAKVGATYVSPFIGRSEDNGNSGIDLLADIVMTYSSYGFATEIIAASVRNTYHITEALKSGVDIITVSPKILESMMLHPLTESGLDCFIKDWNNA